MSGDVYVAKVTTFLTVNGEEVMIRAGETRVREGHALLSLRPEVFQRQEVHFEVEQATARPGEQRKVTAIPEPTTVPVTPPVEAESVDPPVAEQPVKRGPGRPRKNQGE
jgi:hypothetical protein